ncbi:TonB-dependent receptor [Qipengyuania sp. 6B39]|nr:TonB-dependent receptor [Qipengyuania proteolytica]
MMGQAAYAQEASDEPEAASGADENVIVVSGIRQSLANAQNIKRDSDTVVDAITAEDIGALPDRSVTEALQRVPGIAINRFAGSNDPDHFSVEGSGVVIRGLNFVRSEFNGRTAFAAGVGGQALNFADVPSELLGSVLINKNATADLVEGGLAGTVNLVTRKPLDRPGFHIAFSGEANYGDFAKEWTPTFSGLISNTWETDKGTFGLLVAGSYSRIKSRADGLQITNFQTRDGAQVDEAFANGREICRNPLPGSGDSTSNPPANSPCGTAQLPGADGFVDPAGLRYAPLGGQFRTQEFDRKRDGISAAAQFESIDGKTVITAEFIRSHATNRWGEHTFETGPDLAEYGTYPLGCQQNAAGPNRVNTDGSLGDPTTRAQCPVGGFTDYIYDANGLFQSGYITNPNDGWRGNPGTSPFVPIGGLQQTLARREVDESTTNQDWGAHLSTELTDRLHLDLDFQYAKSRKTNLDVTVHGSLFADQEIDLRGDYPSVIPHVPNYLSYSWAGDSDALAPYGRDPSTPATASDDAAYFGDPRFTFWRSAMDHIEESTGTQYAWRADLAYEFDEDSFLREVKVGARFQDRDQTVRYTTYNWGMLSEVWSGDRPVNFEDTGAGNSEFFEFPDFFRGQAPGPIGGYYYNGDLIDGYEESVAFFQSIQDQYRDLNGSPTWNPLAGRPGVVAGTPYLPSEIQPIRQEDDSGYVMLRFGSENFAGMRMSGNIGVRYVNSRIASTGLTNLSAVQAQFAQDRATLCAPIPPVPGRPPATPGGICNLTDAEFSQLEQFSLTEFTPETAKASYDFWLPSLNVKFEVTPDVIVRAAVSKVMTRPDNAYLRNFLNISYNINAGILTADAGNPLIRPATAWQADLTAEWYFATVGSLTANLFYKRVKDFFYQSVGTVLVEGDGLTLPVVVRRPDNFEGTGKIKGFELAYQQTYDFLPAPFDGLGVSANYTYIKSSGLPNTFLNGGNIPTPSTVPPGNLPLEQLSKHNVNATVFYEKGPISMRAAYNWRSRFLLTASDVIFPYYSIFNEPTGQLDASIFFNVTDNIKIGAQGVNLLNEVTKTTQAYTGNPADLAPRSYFMNDRRFSFIIRGNF